MYYFLWHFLGFNSLINDEVESYCILCCLLIYHLVDILLPYLYEDVTVFIIMH